MNKIITSQTKNLIILFLFIMITGCPSKKYQVKNSTATIPQFKKISIAGDEHKSGIFDVSLEYDNDGIGWMAYSRVELPKYVETHIATSHNRGKNWKYIATVNKSYEGTYKYNNKNLKGVWRNETPSLLYDVGDIPSRRWKLFSHHYPAKPPYKKGSHLYAEGWIEYKYAKHPKGPWSKPIRLFGNKKSRSLINLSQLHPTLNNMLWFNEIGSMVVNDVIYLSLDATTIANGLGEWKMRKTILISSPNHGKTWHYAGTLTDYSDANKLGYLTMTGTSLVKQANKLYLLLSPSGKKGLFVKNRGHDGTIVVEIENIMHAKLKRDSKGNLIINKWIKPSLQSGGVSDYDEKNTNGGIIFSQINTSIRAKNADFFQSFNTNKHLSNP